MCGICGWIGTQRTTTPEHINSMLGVLRKRGPDDQHVWCDEAQRTVLGHTRLSIIDLEGSIQPMANEDGTVLVSFNGEIYNYQELRRGLIERGHVLRTQGDTEVLVHLYEDFGSEMIVHLDGMFAFAIYDLRQHTLFLARDRIGIKPLYYWHNPATGELLFGSDLGAMLANPFVPRRLNRRALAQYLHFGFVVHPDTWLDQVRQLEPGQTATWSGGELALARYYEWRYEPHAELSHFGRATTVLEQTLSASVSSHLMADVPLGSFLSGGLDSTAVSGFAQRERARSGANINSFTVGFWVKEYDETVRARSIARDLGTNHQEIQAQQLPFARASMDALIEGLGEPFADTSALAVYLLCQQARPHVKVALSGDGGDELFLGYQLMQKQRLARRFRLAPTSLRRLGATATEGNGRTVLRRLNKYLDLSLLDDPELLMDWHRRWEWSDLRRILGHDLFQQLYPSKTLFPELHKWIGAGRTGGFLEQQMQFWMLAVLPADFLFKMDRMSMAHGLEVRVPMLANRMIDYGRQLPVQMRTQRGRTKEPLRTIVETMSATVAQPAPKHGFGFPIYKWMRSNLAQFWREWELSATLAKIGFQRKELDRLIERYERIDSSREAYAARALTIRLYDLMLLALWCEKHQIHV